MIPILCRNIFTLAELNALEASNSKIASDLSSLYIFSIACMIDSQPASCAAQNFSEPTDEIRPFRIWDTMNLSAIQYQLGKYQGSYQKELNDMLGVALMMLKDYLMCTVSWWLQYGLT